MKRSEINSAIRTALEVLEQHQFYLPPFAYWAAERWSEAGPECERVRLNSLGWDITDFGSGHFDDFGAVLFTLRNGNYQLPQRGTPYAEKVIILKPGQRLPLHFHWSKTEDIINRGGGILEMELYNSLPDDRVDPASPVQMYCDGSRRTVGAGEIFDLCPGESITLTPRMFHRFWAKKDGGILICGEVSAVNDDRTDNLFAEPVSRFADIEEDEIPTHLLSNEYGKTP
jgi:D-lyxose ketol-isomerase